MIKQAIVILSILFIPGKIVLVILVFLQVHVDFIIGFPASLINCFEIF